MGPNQAMVAPAGSIRPSHEILGKHRQLVPPYSQELQENIGDGGGVGVTVRISIIIKMNDNVTVTQGMSTQP